MFTEINDSSLAFTGLRIAVKYAVTLQTRLVALLAIGEYSRCF